MSEHDRLYARALVETMAAAIPGGTLSETHVAVEGYGSRPAPGTHTLLGVTLPKVEHFALIAAVCTVTFPSGQRCHVKATLEVPGEGWTDATMRKALGLPAAAPREQE